MFCLETKKIISLIVIKRQLFLQEEHIMYLCGFLLYLWLILLPYMIYVFASLLLIQHFPPFFSLNMFLLLFPILHPCNVKILNHDSCFSCKIYLISLKIKMKLGLKFMQNIYPIFFICLKPDWTEKHLCTS